MLVKDNIDTAGLATTAGSRLLAGTPPRRDADVVALLRAAGAVILGKTNLTEWGNFRSTAGSRAGPRSAGRPATRSGPTAPVGVLVGVGRAVAAGMAPLALGTETDGSIVCPAGGERRGRGETRARAAAHRGIVPISREVDAVGRAGRSVDDAAIALSVLAGARTARRPGRPAPC